MPNPQQIRAPAGFEHAVALHQGGRIDEAAALYRQLLVEAPDNADLNHLLGVVAGQRGNHQEAVTRIAQAVALAPEQADYRRNLSTAWEMLGRPDRAAEEANEAGRLLIVLRQPAAALAPLDRALALAPGHRGAALNRATALSDMGRHDEAQAALEAIVAIAPGDAVAWNNLGNTLLGRGDAEAAASRYRQALAHDPGYADAYSNLGLALTRLGQGHEAENAVRRALALREAFPEAHVNLGGALFDLARFGEVVACYRRALALQPDFALAHWNLALILLLAGELAEGWREYEWRWRWPEFGEAPRALPGVPEWQGEPPEALDGALLVAAEQGFGDTLQFCRYAAPLAARGYRVILEVQPPLHTLLWSSLGAAGVDVVARTETPLRVQGDPRCAAHVPLLSLPHRLGTTLATIPESGPYLHVDPARAARWRDRLEVGDGRITVGIVWAGRPTHRRDRERSLDPELLAPLAAIPGVRLVSLQRGADERRATLGGFALAPIGPELLDFADTAAVIVNLDLVVTVDTAVAHLAGALGRPAWVLLPLVPDWRWLLDRADSPWYPSLRLYRQRTAGDWGEIIARVAADLADWLPARG